MAGVSDDARPSVFLLRHGATEWSESGQHTGLTDIPLTDEGEAEARSLVPLLAGRSFALVLSSPLSRAMRTAELAGLSDIQGRARPPRMGLREGRGAHHRGHAGGRAGLDRLRR